jgi:hypothetical protein
MFGGDYDATLAVMSNDPDEPEVDVAAHLHVTGVQDIEVSEAELDYGPVFIGATRSDTLTVANAGTDLLTVAGLEVSDAAYAVDGSGLCSRGCGPGRAGCPLGWVCTGVGGKSVCAPDASTIGGGGCSTGRGGNGGISGVVLLMFGLVGRRRSVRRVGRE